MRNFKRTLCVLLCVVLLCLCAFINVTAQTQQGKIIKSSVNMRSGAGTSYERIMTVPIGTVVTILGSTNGQEAEAGCGTTWYHIDYNGTSGYVYGYYVSLISGDQFGFDQEFEKNLENFPESYRGPLRNLHAMFPNWKFVAHYIDMSLEDAIAAQYGAHNVLDTRKVVEFTFGGDEWRDMRAYDGREWVIVDNRWTYASYGAIAHYMDPRTSLTQYSMFVFMQQSFDAVTQTKESLRSVTNGTFLANGYDGNPDAYLDDIMEAALQSGVSPYVLAATIIVEQGTAGTSPLISGTNAGYEGYYNFFNFGTSGNDDALVRSGLDYAWNAGWNSRRASIIGGAMGYADGYISVGQDTYYYKDFNVVNQAWNHQYAQSLYDAWTNGSYLRKGFENNPQAELIFKIPVYTSMREAIYQSPSVETNLPPDTPPQQTVPKGDTNFDGTINAVDLATVKMHILGVKTTEGNTFTAADVNSDGAINAIDLAAVKMHILGVKTIP